MAKRILRDWSRVFHTLLPAAPQALFGFRSGNGLTFVSPYAAARDGQRFLVNTIVDESGNAPLSLVLDWPELVK
jgi:hypothetical protein